jgi:hypothetical protein
MNNESTHQNALDGEKRSIFSHDAALRADVLKRLVALVIAVRRELAPLEPLRKRKRNAVERTITTKSLECSFGVHYTLVVESAAALSVVHDRESVVTRAIFETAQHA